MNITKTLCKNFYNGRFGYKPEIIVIHISGGTEKSMDSWFATPGSQASAHYGIGKDGTTIHQYVEEINGAWANGRVNNPSFKFYKPGINPNYYTISIENEGTDLKLAPEVQIEALCVLIKDIAQRWHIPLDRDHIIGHYQIDAINRSYCPSPDHSLLDKIVTRLKPEEIVNIPVPKSKVDKVIAYLKTI
jgi:N-acetyl-anhydromuramyl-L-alanine amidase AmpD